MAGSRFQRELRAALRGSTVGNKDVYGGDRVIDTSADDLSFLTAPHPALLDSVIRWRGVGGWGAAAALLRAIEIGAVSVVHTQGSVAFELVAGVACSRRPSHGGPFVERGHVNGLASFDRALLEILFDDIAHSSTTDIARLSDYRRTHLLEFWRKLSAWRADVDAEALRLRAAGRLAVNRSLLRAHRPALVHALLDASRPDREWARLAGVGLIADLDDVVVKSAQERLGDSGADGLTGPSAVVWLACLHTGKRSGIDVIRHMFSPLRPSSYPPAQYTTLTLPPHRRLRIVDDGSLRLGG